MHNSRSPSATIARGDAQNGLNVFPTLSDAQDARRHSPLWNVQAVAWSGDAVARKVHVAQQDESDLPARRSMDDRESRWCAQGSANIVVHCPVVSLLDASPRAAQAAKPRIQP